MSDCQDPAASLLAFHANGTLAEEDRRRVESHVAGCIDCSALLGLARLAREEMAAGAFDPAAHVQAQLLSEYVDAPEALEEETRAWVSSHLQGCEVCASVVPVLRQMSGAGWREGIDKPPGFASASARLWEILEATILRPLPAMAYLALVVVGLIWFARTGGPGLVEGDPAALLPPPVPLHAEIEMRGGASAAPPLRLETSPGIPLRLALHTDLDPEETTPGAPRLRLVLRRGNDVLWTAPVDPGTIPGDGVLEMTLRPERFPHGIPLEIALVHDAAAGQAPLFLKRILLAEPGDSPSPEGL